MNKKKIIIVGGGFGGIKAALILCRNPLIDLTLITPNKEFRYYPTLFKVATGGNRSGASIPLSEVFKDRDIKIIQDKVTKINREKKYLTISKKTTLEYDEVIFAIGVITNYFNISGMEKYSFNIKTQAGAEHFKNHIHKQLIEHKIPDLNYVIVGGGPTGVELAGALPSYLNYVFKCHGIENKKVHIDIVEAKDKLLPRMPLRVGKKVAARLVDLGINVYLNAAVEGESGDELSLDGRIIKTHTVVWTAGVANNPFFKNNDFVIMKNGLVAVDSFLKAEKDIYVIGDNANTPYSGMAQTALHDAEFVSENILRSLYNQNLKSYKAKKPISIVPVGRRWAAVNWGRFCFYGIVGQILRQFADLLGFSEIEPLNKAFRQLFYEYKTAETCEVCSSVDEN